MPRDHARHIIRMTAPLATDPMLMPSWEPAASDADRHAARIGYARVSTPSQNLDLQLKALNAYGCEIVHTDRASGASLRRAGLREAIRQCRSGDELVVWRLDRLGRDLRGLLDLDAVLAERHITLKVLTGQLASFETRCTESRVIFAIMAAISSYEIDVTSERTRAGLDAARTQAMALSPPFLSYCQLGVV